MKEWINVREARIAITGGAGFIGRAIAKRLLTEGVREVIVLSRKGVAPPAFEEWRASGRLKIIRCDIRDRDKVREALAGCDAVFHQAAIRVTQGAREPQLASEIMVNGTFHVVSAC